MQDQTHIVFVPKQAQSTYITVLFWATCDVQQLCSRMRHVWAVQQEVLNQGVNLTFQVECVFALKNYLVYVVDKSSDYKLVNAKQPLPNEDDQAQFESETLHSLKTVKILVPSVCVLTNRKINETYCDVSCGLLCRQTLFLKLPCYFMLYAGHLT